jgi:hypothetical protein
LFENPPGPLCQRGEREGIGFFFGAAHRLRPEKVNSGLAPNASSGFFVSFWGKGFHSDPPFEKGGQGDFEIGLVDPLFIRVRRSG